MASNLEGFHNQGKAPVSVVIIDASPGQVLGAQVDAIRRGKGRDGLERWAEPSLDGMASGNHCPTLMMLGLQVTQELADAWLTTLQSQEAGTPVLPVAGGVACTAALDARFYRNPDVLPATLQAAEGHVRPTA